MFSNGRDVTNCHNFCTKMMTDNDDAKAIPQYSPKTGKLKTLTLIMNESSKSRSRKHY